jgi:hypothetical protein
MPNRLLTHSSDTAQKRTCSGDAASEARVQQDLARVVTGVGSELGEALLGLWLVGPFAVGEGGIREREKEPLAHPGYEVLALLRKHPGRHVAALQSLSEAWSRLLGTRVTLRGVRARDLPRAPATAFWLEVSQGGFEILSGTPGLRDELPQIDPQAIDPKEPTRLLSGALCSVALAQLETSSLPLIADRVHRLALAIGDAWLLRTGRYPVTRVERENELERALPARELLPAYREAREHLAAPDALRSAARPLDRFVELNLRRLAHAFLALEALRVASPPHVFGYIRHPSALCAPWDEHQLWSRARSVALRFPRVSRLALSADERLLRASVSLALAREAPACRSHAAGLLRLAGGLGPASDGELATALRQLASQVLADPLGHPFVGLEFLPSP